MEEMHESTKKYFMEVILGEALHNTDPKYSLQYNLE